MKGITKDCPNCGRNSAVVGLEECPFCYKAVLREQIEKLNLPIMIGTRSVHPHKKYSVAIKNVLNLLDNHG